MSPNKTALITGVTGQDGSYLAEILLEKGYTVHGLRRRNSSFNTSRIDHLLESSKDFFLHDGDLTDTSGLFALLSEIKPCEIYNLGAQSHVGSSFFTPEYTANVDALGTLRLLEGIRQLSDLCETKFYQASTSELYGNSLPPQSESTAFAPRSPYAVAKLYAHWITINYRESYNIFASCGILFNHESSRRGPTFVSQKIINGIKKHLIDDHTFIVLGNLNAKRDWGHAKEYAHAMWKMLQLNQPIDLVLGTGMSYSVRDFATMAAKEVDLNITWEGNEFEETGYTQFGNVIFKVSPDYYRPSDVAWLQADSAKARELLDWHPKMNIQELIKEMFKAANLNS